MKAMYLSVPQQSMTSCATDLVTSDGHSSRMALRYELIIYLFIFFHFKLILHVIETYYFVYLANLLPVPLYWKATLMVSVMKNPKKRMKN